VGAAACSLWELLLLLDGELLWELLLLNVTGVGN
jgi:hypothetical protein